MGEHKGELVGDRVGVDRHRDGAEHLRRHHRPVEPGPVGADDGDGVAALEPEAGEPCRIGAHLLQHLLPGPDLPDAEVLVPIGRPARIKAGIADQELGERVRASGGVDRQDATSLLRPRVGRACWFVGRPVAAVPRGCVVQQIAAKRSYRKRTLDRHRGVWWVWLPAVAPSGLAPRPPRLPSCHRHSLLRCRGAFRARVLNLRLPPDEGRRSAERRTW